MKLALVLCFFITSYSFASSHDAKLLEWIQLYKKASKSKKSYIKFIREGQVTKRSLDLIEKIEKNLSEQDIPRISKKGNILLLESKAKIYGFKVVSLEELVFQYQDNVIDLSPYDDLVSVNEKLSLALKTKKTSWLNWILPSAHADEVPGWSISGAVASMSCYLTGCETGNGGTRLAFGLGTNARVRNFCPDDYNTDPNGEVRRINQLAHAIEGVDLKSITVDAAGNAYIDGVEYYQAIRNITRTIPEKKREAKRRDNCRYHERIFRTLVDTYEDALKQAQGNEARVASICAVQKLSTPTRCENLSNEARAPSCIYRAIQVYTYTYCRKKFQAREGSDLFRSCKLEAFTSSEDPRHNGKNLFEACRSRGAAIGSSLSESVPEHLPDKINVYLTWQPETVNPNTRPGQNRGRR